MQLPEIAVFAVQPYDIGMGTALSSNIEAPGERFGIPPYRTSSECGGPG